MQPDRGMAATFRQEHCACLWVGPLAILIAAAPKGVFVGRRSRQIEQAAIQRHQPMALIPRPRRLLLTQHMGALLTQLLDRFDSQQFALLRERRGPGWLLR